MTRAEDERRREILTRLALLQRILNATPAESEEPLALYQFLSRIKSAQGNISNDLSFVACLLAKRYLTTKHDVVGFDAAAKAQGAPGLDIDLKTTAGKRIIAEIKTTDPYLLNDFGSNQRTKFREDFLKLNKTPANFKYLFVTEQRTYDILQRKYAGEIPNVRIVLLT